MAPSAVLLVRDNMPKRCAPPSHSAAELGVTQPFASHEAPLEKVSQCIGGGDGGGMLTFRFLTNSSYFASATSSASIAAASVLQATASRRS